MIEAFGREVPERFREKSVFIANGKIEIRQPTTFSVLNLAVPSEAHALSGIVLLPHGGRCSVYSVLVSLKRF
jgi:hypothetical protein